MSAVDAPDAARIAALIAEKAGSLLLEHFRDESLASDWKKDYSIVTKADVEADELIALELARHFPDDAILSEELAPEFTQRGRRTWIVDPLDGTTNFSLGMQHWGVSIARCDAMGPDVGVLFFPALGELYVASRGEGATLGGATIRARVPSLERPVGVLACDSRTLRFYHVSLPMKVRVSGAAAYTLASVARGSAVIGIETRPKIWDIAAAWCLIEEAGGAIETSDGSAPFPLAEGVEYASTSFPVRAAASLELLEQAREHIELR